MTETESEWTADERSYVLASRSRENDMGPHGQLMSEATDDHTKFVAKPIPKVDKARKALIDAQEKYYKQWPDAERQRVAHLWTVEKLPD